MINWILFILTLFSTTWAGSVWWILYVEPEVGLYDAMFLGLSVPEYFLYGAIFFALPLMLILGIHELGHYFISKKHGVDASLPFFIPVPPPFMLGTMGAFISMREPIPNKKALLDIGAAGPICGFLVALPVLIIGLLLTNFTPSEMPEVSGDLSVINFPLLFIGLVTIFPIPENSLLHPTAFAGWVGLLVTALNLLPGGQLDGGHISRALFGNNAKYISYATVIFLIVMTFTTGFMAWLFFAFIIMILGTQHPPPLEDLSKLDTKRKAVGVFCIIMLFICIHPIPIEIISIEPEEYNLSYECLDNEQVVDIGGYTNYSVGIVYSGESSRSSEFKFRVEYINSTSENWDIKGYWVNVSFDLTQTQKVELEPDEHVQVYIEITSDYQVDYGDEIILTITGDLENSDTNYLKSINTTVSTVNLYTPTQTKRVFAGNIVPCNISVTNIATQQDTILIDNSPLDQGWEIEFEVGTLDILPFSSEKLNFNIISPEFAVTGEKVVIVITGVSSRNAMATDSVMIVIEIV
jgi:Zn-dependent protease